MSNEEKKNSFKGYQEEMVANRLVIITEQITIYKKQRVKFKNITEMCEVIAQQITKKEGKPCSTSTIIRNKKYKELLEDYYYSQEGVKRPGEITNLIAELSASNVERENLRLKQYITSLEKELDNIKNNQVKVIQPSEDIKYLTNDENKVANLSKALHQLINHCEGLVAFNENGDLIDLTKLHDNVIVKKELMG